MKYSGPGHQPEIFIGLLPVKYQYPFENKYLRNDFAERFKVPANIEISAQPIAGSVPVKSLCGIGKLLFQYLRIDVDMGGGYSET